MANANEIKATISSLRERLLELRRYL